MKPSEIQAGHTYRNAGNGSTKRTVLEIYPSFDGKKWNVHYTQNGTEGRVSLIAFARWAGEEVKQ